MLNIPLNQDYNFIAGMTSVLPSYSHSKNEHYLIAHDKVVKCVCELCSCGKHRCPRQQIKGQFDTSYAQHYKNFTVLPSPQLSSKPKTLLEERHYNPQALRSHYQEAYVERQRRNDGREGGSSSRLENVGREILKSGPFVANTSYKDQYKPFIVEPELEQYPASSSPQPQSSPQKDSRVKFQGQSSYKSAYHSLPIQKLDRYRHPESKNPAPFTGSSSYKAAFSPFRIQPAILPPSTPQSPPVKFEGSSTYNSHFKGFEVRAGAEVGVGRGSGCEVDGLTIPPNNYISKNPHLYYDHNRKQFL